MALVNVASELAPASKTAPASQGLPVHPRAQFRRSHWFSGATRRRSARFTTEGTRFVFFTLAVGIAAINTGNNLFYLLVAMMLSLITMSGLLSELCLRKLQVSCHAPDNVYAGSPATLTLAVTNTRSRFPSFSLRLAEVVEGRAADRTVQVKHLPGGTTVLVSLPIHVATRGPYHVEGIQIATPFPFGLFVKRVFLPHPLSLVVLPQPRLLSENVLDQAVAAGTERMTTRRGPGADLYNLRLYQPGDDSRLIHWMSTARTSQLIIRETQTDTHPRVTVHLSTAAPADAQAAFERAVTLSASLVAHFLARGFEVTMRVDGEMAVSGREDDDLPRLLRPLALCVPRVPEECDGQTDVAANPLAWADQDGMTFAIMPWSSPMLRSRIARATHVFLTSDASMPGASDGVGTSLSA